MSFPTAASVMLFVVIFLAMCASGWLAAALGGGSAASTLDGGPGNLIVQIEYVTVFALTVALTLSYRAKAVGRLCAVNTLIPFMVWAAASLSWSVVPDIAIRRFSFTVIVIFSVGALVALQRDAASLVKVLLIASGLMMTLDVLSGVLFPGISVYPPGSLFPGQWHGLHDHKNGAGKIAAIAIIYWFWACFLLRRRAISVFFLFLSIFFLIKTGSKTSIGFVCIGILGGYSLVLASRKGWKYAALGLCLPLLFIVFLTALPFIEEEVDAFLLAVFGDLTFTGRTLLWDFLWHYIGNNLTLGSGFGSMWQIGDQTPALHEALWTSWVSQADHGHNGYLDMAAALGIPGLAFAMLFVLTPLRDIVGIRRGQMPIKAMLLSVWVFGLLHNCLESSIFDRGNPIWVFMVVSIYALRRLRLEETAQEQRTIADGGMADRSLEATTA